ncbi:hypothetical protein MIMGU_mgv1a005064mg [Erythranthe guttata]|uniref:WD repeat-containing protein 76 n=1 Tax=Erythranthe guttata TaxID=4155 RepID=A0A022QV57_ERYGU|nr:PREDICTED: WD repeat-containing protein 76 [Erythranthe guttata]EYU31796.1 hypothetical protein MIMGU_mgv1a005064mg [Erythranthe guttata]|eukprot:XP_012844154.1 PREDICTED: WD repeat-containing protein 76 [Erythranthe guttata]
MGEKLTEYERRRLENIKRNDEMVAALKIHSRLNDLSAAAAASKRQRDESKSSKRSPVKKPRSESPVVLRRSLRSRGVPPDAATASGPNDDLTGRKLTFKNPQWNSRESTEVEGPLKMSGTYLGGDDGLNQKLIRTILQCSKKSVLSSDGDKGPRDSTVKLEKSEEFEKFIPGKRLTGSIDVNAFQLKPENIARVVPSRIMSLKFFPTVDMEMVVAGNKFGDVGFWNVNRKNEGGGGIYLYHPHSRPISGIVIDPFCISKMYTSCYDGFIRLMDVEKEIFDMVYYSDYTVYSMSQSPHDVKSLYFSEGRGGVNKWDVRAGKSCLKCDLHDERINTIDFNSENENIMATSSSDNTARIWDLRRINAVKPTPLKIVSHKRAVHSAYFSPTGKFLATTSLDDKVGLSSGANYEDTSMVYHYNRTGCWISTFRGIWGWDDSSIYIGNMKRGLDVISVEEAKTVTTLGSDLVSAITCRYEAHPYNVGMLAGATGGGQVYIWTQS